MTLVATQLPLRQVARGIARIGDEIEDVSRLLELASVELPGSVTEPIAALLHDVAESYTRLQDHIDRSTERE